MNIFQTLGFYLGFPFVQYLVVVGIFTALCASLIGVPLVLKRYSLVGMGLSNVAFVGYAFAILVIGLNNELFITMPLTVLTSIILLGPLGRNKLKGDASMAMLAIGALAVGFFIVNVFSYRGEVDINAALFGATNILTLRLADVWISLAVTIVTLLAFVLLHNRLFAITFDSNFMNATGSRPWIYEYLFAALVGIIVAISMQLVGALLTAALIIFPAISALKIFKTYKLVMISAAIIGLLCALFGIFTAIIFATPVGATIIVFNIAVYAILYLSSFIYKKTKRKN